MVEGTVCNSFQVVLARVQLLARNGQLPPLPLHTKMCTCDSHIPFVPGSQLHAASLASANIVALCTPSAEWLLLVFITFALLHFNFSIQFFKGKRSTNHMYRYSRSTYSYEVLHKTQLMLDVK